MGKMYWFYVLGGINSILLLAFIITLSISVISFIGVVCMQVDSSKDNITSFTRLYRYFTVSAIISIILGLLLVFCPDKAILQEMYNLSIQQ